MFSKLTQFAGRLDQAMVSGFDSERFDSMALELFGLQWELNPAWQKLCRSRGVHPQSVSNWREIPCVPTAVFKLMDFSCLPEQGHLRVFHSSGTTGQTPGRHRHSSQSLALYEQSAWLWFKHNWGEVQDMIVLLPPPSLAPHSSLAHMIETIRCRENQTSDCFKGHVDGAGVWCVDWEPVIEELQQAAALGKPVDLFGTAFLYVHLLDELETRKLSVKLPAGSKAMETGGYKNRSREMPKAELHAWMGRRLGLLPGQIICEYGMSELSSQAYGRNGDGLEKAERLLRLPPWARVRVVSPENGEEAAQGETGLIQVFDLANAFSVMAIQTEDLGVWEDLGFCGLHGFELLGRSAKAEPRGCSLMTP